MQPINQNSINNDNNIKINNNKAQIVNNAQINDDDIHNYCDDE